MTYSFSLCTELQWVFNMTYIGGILK